jgi:thiol-disulfide isomerase/thioredoxin
LEDFQPNSIGFGDSYGLSSFEGKVTLVALLAGWCSYCRKQALHLETLSRELLDERYDINIIAINKDNAASPDHQRALLYILNPENQIQKTGAGDPVYRCTFPLFQDAAFDPSLEEDPENPVPNSAWELHNGNKDDFFIYGADGELIEYLPRSNPLFSTNLGTEVGYTNVKQALIDAYQASLEEESETPSAQ